MTPPGAGGAAAVTAASVPEALRRYVEHAPLAFAITSGARHTLVYANTTFRALTGSIGKATIGAPIAAALSAADGRALNAILDKAFRESADTLDEALGGGDDPGTAWRCSVWPVVGPDGRTEALGIEIRDLPEVSGALKLQRDIAEQLLLGALRERGLADTAESARRRAAFLAEAGRLLAESVDQTSTFVALAKLALPVLGAWCILDILEDNDSIRRLGIYHPDPAKLRLARQLEATWLPRNDDPFGAAAMLRERTTVAITEGIEATIAATARSPENLDILRQLGVGSLLTVPLLARGRLLGAITFVSARPGFAYGPEDRQLAEDLAARAALALDNAQIYEASELMRRSAESANRAKTTFLGAMSHELRTPLNAIGGYIDILDMGLRGPVTESQHADFARVRTSQQHLARLITELLDFARVGSGRVTYAVAEIDAREALRHAIDLVEPLFGQKKLVLDGIEGAPGVVASGDPERVTQILVNLLSNAIKFTPPGGHIGAGCAVSGDSVTMSIRDTGIGIAPEKMETMFEPFVQLKNGFSDRESGVGLGLAISRDLARAMKGDLTVESTEGTGSRFTLVLPRASGLERP